MNTEGKSKGTKGRGRFIVDIRCRENATWQGDVCWVEQNKQCSFASVLELFKLIDGTLDRVEAGEGNISSNLFIESPSMEDGRKGEYEG